MLTLEEGNHKKSYRQLPSTAETNAGFRPTLLEPILSKVDAKKCFKDNIPYPRVIMFNGLTKFSWQTIPSK